jgi:hypothetical protein
MSHSTKTSSLFSRDERTILPGVGDWESFASFAGQLIKDMGRTHGLSDQETQELQQYTLTRIWEWIKTEPASVPQEDLSYRVVNCTWRAALDVITRCREEQEAHGNAGGIVQWLHRHASAVLVPGDAAIDEAPSDELLMSLAPNLTALVRDRLEDSAQMARDCILTILQRASDDRRAILVARLISESDEFVARKFGPEAVQAIRSQFDADSWHAFLLIGVLGFCARDLEPWLKRRHVELQKLVGRVRRAFGH